MQRLSKEELIDLVLRLQRQDKTSRTSSKPPSTDRKEKRENARPGGAKHGHESHTRQLCENSDAFEDHIPNQCSRCGGALSRVADLALIGEYDAIEIPPVKPHVTRHRRFACRCPHCGSNVKAMAPAVATTTPFGPRIHALAVYSKSFQALSYERLRFMFRDCFGLCVSDETAVWIEGSNSYHWVFYCKDALVHQSDYSRAARVIEEIMQGHKPEVWTSDRYSAQKNHRLPHKSR